MSEQEVLDKVIQLISERFSVDVLKITKDTTFQEDLGADSLSIVEIVMGVEEEFDLEIPDEDADSLTTVGLLKQYISDNS